MSIRSIKETMKRNPTIYFIKDEADQAELFNKSDQEEILIAQKSANAIYEDLMNKAKKAFSMVNTHSFDLKDILNLGDTVLMDNGIFSEKILIEHVTPNGLPLRLRNAADKSYLPYPFVFSPSRKDCFKDLLPLPKAEQMIIEGYSQSGKTNLACHLCLMYRMKPQNHAVMYTGNMTRFNMTPLNYLKEESFYWFYEEIENNLMAQIVMSYLVDFDEIEGIFKAIKFLSKLAKAKGKIPILIIDQYNRFLASEGLVTSILRFLMEISENTIFVMTNSANQIQNYRSSDILLHKPLVLDEREKRIDKNEMKKVIKKLFNKEDDYFSETLFNETQGDLNLIFLFFDHCAEKMVLTNEEFDFSDEYKEFAREYSNKNLTKHNIWIKENNIKEFTRDHKNMMNMLMFLDMDIQYSEVLEENLLDTRYIYQSKDWLIKSINPLISKIFREKYWNFSLIEKLLNNYSNFGGVFEYYFRAKMEQMNNKGTPIRIIINGNVFSFGYVYKSYVIYSQKYTDNITFLNEKVPKNQSVLYSTDQKNFPLFDFILHIPGNDVAIMLNVRKKLHDDPKMVYYFETFSE